MFKIKRVYEPVEKSDGFRILIDRLWPRGVSKEKAKVDLWMKEIAPSNELRTKFHHDPKNWHQFEKAYQIELKNHQELIDKLNALDREYKTITLLFGAKETQFNNAVVLLNILTNH